jgi:hypothetical protein
MTAIAPPALPALPPSPYVFSTDLVDPSLRVGATQDGAKKTAASSGSSVTSLATLKGKTKSLNPVSARKQQQQPTKELVDHIMVYIEVSMLASTGSGSRKKSVPTPFGPVKTRSMTISLKLLHNVSNLR